MNVAIIVLLTILLLSAISGWWLAGRKAQEKAVKVMMFVGYFWLLTFIQVSILAVWYYFRNIFPFFKFR